MNGETKTDLQPGLRLSSIFSEGHAIHEKWQRWLKEAGLLIGAEVPVVLDKYRIHGHADGLLNIDGETVLLEIKSIGIGTLRHNNHPIEGSLAYSFRLVSKPFPEHVRQAMLYAWVLKQQGHDISRVLFLYECKEDQAVKELVAKYSDDYLLSIMDNLRLLFPNEDGELGDTPPCIGVPDCPCGRFQ